MFDFDLQLRFWRSAMDALLHSTQASMAATAAWQDQIASQVSNGPTNASAQSETNNPWAWMMPTQNNPWLAAYSIFETNPMFGALSPPSNPFFPTQPAMSMWMPFALAFPNASSGWTAPGAANFFPDLIASLWTWPTSPWALYQTPLTAMMMSAGMPYNVASPSAKAGTSAMDAADAARQQMDNVLSAYQSDGGHAAAQAFTLPWIFAASFASGSAQPADVSSQT